MFFFKAKILNVMKTATGPYKYSLLDPENPAETLEATTFAVFDLDDILCRN
jgi:hypothetical protein